MKSTLASTNNSDGIRDYMEAVLQDLVGPVLATHHNECRHLFDPFLSAFPFPFRVYGDVGSKCGIRSVGDGCLRNVTQFRRGNCPALSPIGMRIRGFQIGLGAKRQIPRNTNG